VNPFGCHEKCCARHCDSGCKLDSPSRVDRKGVAGRMHEALPPKFESERGATPQGKAEHEPGWLPREPSCEDILSI